MSAPRPAGQKDEERELKVFSFNVWGLWLVSKDREIRIKAIAQFLASQTYDIVCLQELWMYEDFLVVRNEVEGVLPFSRFFHTGALGSGLAVFTRFPIISAQALPYSLSGSPQQAFAGDFFVKKAAANVVVLHPTLGEVEIWNTHMHAAGEHPPDTRQAHRIAEAWQLANAIRGGAAKGRYVLAMGDFNSQPFSVPVALLRTHAQMSDSFLDTHPRANMASSPISPLQAVHLLGMTCDSPLNTYSHGKPIPANITAQGGKRLDYIFYRQPEIARRRPLIWGYRDHQASPAADNGGGGDWGPDTGKLEAGKPLPSSVQNAPQLRCTSSEVVLTDRVPGHDLSWSDHFGLLSTFAIDVPDKDTDKAPEGSGSTSKASGGASFTPLVPLISDDAEAINETTTTFSPPSPPPTARRGRPSHRTTASTDSTERSSTIQTALNTMRMYATLSARSSNAQLRYCAASLFALVALAVGSAWQPKSYIQPIFTVLAGLLGAAAATFLYTGFVWGRWEEGLLRETLEEMELELRVVEMEEKAARAQT